MSERQQHWENVYTTKSITEVSWYRSHLDLSLEWIQRVSPDPTSAIIDIGGGASTLVDDLLQLGYSHLTVLDVSSAAIEAAKARLGAASQNVTWHVADICEPGALSAPCDLWHNRAVFHFLTAPDQRAAYVARASASVKPNGHLIVATFGPDGPTRCSGLDAVRYDAPALAANFAPDFRLIDNRFEWHTTPSGGRQQFLYTMMQRT